MLGFVLSKMQMLLFAVGIAVVALMFYDFVSRIGLSESATNLSITESKLISDQLNNDLLCTYKKAAIPDRLLVGVGGTPFFYDMIFSKGTYGDADLNTLQNLLSVKVVEHTSRTNVGPNVVAARSLQTESNIVLVDPGFIAEGKGLGNYYDKTAISLYPRAALKSGSVQVSPNAFVALSEVIGGKKTLYVIPCATEKEPNNCEQNILRVGCYKLKLAKAAGAVVEADTLLPSCFNNTTILSDTVGAGGYTETQSQNWTWKNCTNQFVDIVNNP